MPQDPDESTVEGNVHMLKKKKTSLISFHIEICNPDEIKIPKALMYRDCSQSSIFRNIAEIERFALRAAILDEIIKPPLSSFNTHPRWLPVTQSARSSQSCGNIGDCEQSILYPAICQMCHSFCNVSSNP